MYNELRYKIRWGGFTKYNAPFQYRNVQLQDLLDMLDAVNGWPIYFDVVVVFSLQTNIR